MTPRNVLFLGNSHTAAPRIALRDDPDRWPGFAPDVFAMPGHSLIALELDGRTLVTPDDEARRKMVYYNGVPDLPVSGYDAFVVIGGLAFHQQAILQETHRSLDFPSARRDGNFIPVSTGFVDALLRHQLEHSPALRMARMLAGLDQGPVLFLDQVLPSTECRQDPDQYGAYVALAERGDAADYRARYLRILEPLLAGGAIHLPQPASTMVADAFTAPEWMRGSIRMQPRRDVPHEASDYGHANPAYGRIQVDQITEALARL
ncbi:hypothetical protein ACFOMH_02225 [Paracoccus mangrovi]|uniref:Uncharacterized protein n=1 Tax=Paracoccus mangrovi TaxID=1715645 RepID=A0ABV7R102_9RHOB